jgi:hypothetical protein
MTTRAQKIANTNTWPFTVELLNLKDLMVDQTYQRPPQETFVQSIVDNFDEILVGTLDVAERKDGTHAILDGAQRFEALQKFKANVWCSVYKGMSIKDEAQFFYRKNRNRRGVHPFYQLRALIVTGDKTAIAINRIVESEGYKLEVGGVPDHIITAIRAVEDCYAMNSLQRKESLSPTLHVMRQCFYGRKSGKEGELIKGLGKFFQPFGDNEIDMDWLIDVLAGQNPQTLIGRATDKAQTSRHPRAYWLAKDIVEIYNRGRKAGYRLYPSYIVGNS